VANEQDLTVELPGGGVLTLETAQEVELWNTSAARYLEDYAITKQNDKTLLGSVLIQQLIMYRAQIAIAKPGAKKGNFQKQVTDASTEIRDIEKALGIDKKAREAGGQHTIASYLTILKRAAHAKGIKISERVKAYEEFAMEMRWRIRLLRNGDSEDRQYHPDTISEKTLVAWAEKELAALEAKDKAWARDKGAVFVGQI
jgi:hypothetical protein